MKLKKQLNKLQNFLNAEIREQKLHHEDLKRLLHKMKLKEKSLTERLELETDSEERDRLNRKIELLHAQRRKGIQALRDIEN